MALSTRRIEHLSGRADRTLTARSMPRIEHRRDAETADRTPPESPDARIDTLPTRSMPWIDTLRGRRARGSRSFRPARSCSPNTCRTRGSNTYAARWSADRTLAPCSTPRGSNTCAVAGGADRTDPSCSMPRIEHLRRRRNRGSNTSGGARSRGSRPFGVAGRADRHPSGPREPADRTLAGRADRTLGQPGGVRIEHLRRRRNRGSNTSGGARSRGSRPFGVAGRTDRHPSDPIRAMDRHPSRAPGARIDTLPARANRRIEHLPGARIEHLRRRRRRGSNTCRTHGSNTCAVSGGADRDPSESPDARIDTPPARSMPWIDTLRGRRARGSTPFRSARSCGSNTCRTCGSNTCTLLHARGSNTCPVFGGSDRTDPVCSIPRIETLRSRRARGSTPFRPDPCHGSTPLAGAGRADRHPSGRIRAMDRHPSRAPGARIETLPVRANRRIEHLRTRRRRGSNSSSSLHAADRHPSRSPERRSTPFRRLDPMDRHPSAPSDRHPSRSPNSADRHAFRGLDPMDRDPSPSSGRGSTPFTVAGRRESGRSSGGTAVSTERPAALRLPTRFDCA